MGIHRGDTALLNERVGKCENLSELKDILNSNNEYHYEWKQYINRLVEKNHVNYVQMAALCHSSRNTVKRWCRDGMIPQNRQTFLKIAFGFRLSLDETNELLQYYGKYPGLYAKTMEDAIAIFLLSHEEETGDLYLIYQNMHHVLLDRVQDMQAKNVETECIDTLILLGVHLNMSVEYINDMLALAYMPPTSAKDNLECVIMYAVESAYLNNPSYTIESAMILKHYEANPAIQKKCREILEKYWETDEAYRLFFQEENSFNENISSYLKEVLTALEWDEEIFKYL